ncbi:hypothetical protein BT69DRAFT_1327913 [Atractiella rhizophila]|nr:hypothetical protein BT69DRAFT_1327913 [Atractiella rhizophila]
MMQNPSQQQLNIRLRFHTSSSPNPPSPKKSLFLLGPGYIGGAILHALLTTSPYKDTFTFSALVRREEQAQKLRELGVRPVFGGLDDTELIASETRASDVIINAASSDHLPSVRAILHGISTRCDSSKPIVYIHTSGTGELCKYDDGELSEYVYDDTLPAEMDERLEDDAPHRQMDLEIKRFVEGKEGGDARIQIVLPPLIYGIGEGPFNRLSQQIPNLVRLAIKEGYSGYWGKGEAIWNNVSIQSLVSGYLLILSNLLSPSPDLSSLYYFAETGSHSWKSLASSIGLALKKRGKIDGEAARSWERGIFGKEEASYALSYGGNSRSKATRLRRLGWTGKSERNIWEDVEWEVDEILKGL